MLYPLGSSVAVKPGSMSQSGPSSSDKAPHYSPVGAAVVVMMMVPEYVPADAPPGISSSMLTGILACPLLPPLNNNVWAIPESVIHSPAAVGCATRRLLTSRSCCPGAAPLYSKSVALILTPQPMHCFGFETRSVSSPV